MRRRYATECTPVMFSQLTMLSLQFRGTKKTKAAEPPKKGK